MRTRLLFTMLCFAAGLRAQEGTTTVRITLDGDLCDRVRERTLAKDDPSCPYPINVVYNGNDVTRKACFDRPPCQWVWRVEQPLNPKLTAFSLRLGPEVGRTRCRHAQASDPWNLQVTFTRAGRDRAQKLDIGGPPVFYMRVVDPLKEEGDVRCGEKRLLASTLDDVQLDVEDVRLQVYKRKTAYCGVVVDDLLKDKTDVSVGPKELAPVVAQQGFQARHCHAPTLLPPGVAAKTLEAEQPAFQIKVK